MELLGYTNRLDAAPTDTVQFMVSSNVGPFDVEVVRLVQGDTSPEGPGFKSESIEQLGRGLPGASRPFPRGSYVVAPRECTLKSSEGFAVAAWVYPTLFGSAQGLISLGPESGFALYIASDGQLAFDVGGRTLLGDRPLTLNEWHFVGATYSPDGEATVWQVPKHPHPLEPPPAWRPTRTLVPSRLYGSYFLIGALNDVATVEPETAHSHFNGKISAPRVYARAMGLEDMVALKEGHPVLRFEEKPLASWDFARTPASVSVADTSGNSFDGMCVNAPMRAVTGWNYSGGGGSFADAPDEYDAIMFHADDLDDARWPVSFEYRVPESLSSGVYAARVTASSGPAEDYIPFFVTPSAQAQRAPIAMLMPTFSYLAYANEHYSITNPASPVSHNVWDYVQPEDECARNEELLSLYDYHRDGSGNAHSSMLRPLLNMRPKYHMPLLRGPHQFPADLYIIDWLTEMNFAHDVLTDHAVHRDGVELLNKYRVLITGSHPEYWTEPLWRAVKAYLAQGGRAMYLGGNGMYWSISTSSSRPHMIEIQRGHSGTGAWYSLPGEEFTSLTGERGGIWRNRGLSPQSLFGVGFSASGYDVALPYYREAGSFDPRAAFIFDDIPSDAVIGDAGLVMGGAAGLEIDRADVALGTPPHALVVATARGFSDSYQAVVEEVNQSDSKQGGTVSPLVRADMVYFEGPLGGAVFSVGSITWSGSLSHNRYNNCASKIMKNVLSAFADEKWQPVE